MTYQAYVSIKPLALPVFPLKAINAKYVVAI